MLVLLRLVLLLGLTIIGVEDGHDVSNELLADLKRIVMISDKKTR